MKRIIISCILLFVVILSSGCIHETDTIKETCIITEIKSESTDINIRIYFKTNSSIAPEELWIPAIEKFGFLRKWIIVNVGDIVIITWLQTDKGIIYDEFKLISTNSSNFLVL